MLATLIDHNEPIGEEKGKVYDRVVSSVPLSVWDVLSLTAPHITLKRCSTLLSTEDDGDSHNCMDVILCSSKPHPGLSETPLFKSSSIFNLVFHTDGSAHRKYGVPCAGYAICDYFSITDSTALPPSSSPQVAELFH